MTDINVQGFHGSKSGFLSRYLKEYKLIYIAVIISNLCCFNFHFVFNTTNSKVTPLIIFASLFFLASFIIPIILGLLFTMRCFVAQTRKKLLSNIIHSYVGILLIFAALYYQCAVLGDFTDAVHKRDLYAKQISLKRNVLPDMKIMRVADQRAFKGIKPRIWSGYDYPGSSLLKDLQHQPDALQYFVINDYESLTVEQIEQIGNNITGSAKVFEYQRQNVLPVYTDCLYFSVICIATVGFGDISPDLWFTKLFTALEIFIGLSIFVFAIGILFSNWIIKPQDNG